MSYIRSKVRYNCFCMRKGVTPPDSEVVSVIEKQLGNRKWSDFTDTWDILVTNNKITVVSNIKDINKVTEICMYAHIAAKSGLEISPEEPEDKAIIHMIESQFLDGKMTWENYRSKWSLRWDDERKRIETYLLKLPYTQIPVTQEMIDMVLQRGIAETNEMYKSADGVVQTSKEEK